MSQQSAQVGSSSAVQICLVTGASGFLGTALIHSLRAAGFRVIGVTRQATTEASSGLERRQGDLRLAEFWQRELSGVDLVIHLAAQTSVYVADQEPAKDWEANVLPMLQLLESCRQTARRPFILFAGSATQCGLATSLPVSEREPDRPVTIYDRHKLAAEQYLEHYVSRGWARGATLRLANVYGPGPASSSSDRGVLNQMIRRALRGEDLTVYGEGKLVRDYVYLEDVVDAFLRAAASADRINGMHFMVGSGRGCTLVDAFALVAERVGILTGNRVQVRHVPAPTTLSPIESRNFVADISALAAATNWRPTVDLATGIDRTARNFVNAVNA
jgi:UDP-glucose 4-epimerase